MSATVTPRHSLTVELVCNLLSDRIRKRELQHRGYLGQLRPRWEAVMVLATQQCQQYRTSEGSMTCLPHQAWLLFCACSIACMSRSRWSKHNEAGSVGASSGRPDRA